MPESRRFPKPWTAERIPGGYRIRDGSGMPLAYVYGRDAERISVSEETLTADEARRISKLIARLPELVELETDRNRNRSRRKPPPLRIRPVTIGDLIRDNKLLEVHCGACRPVRHLYIDAGCLGLPRRMPVPEVADHLVCSRCGARNSDTHHPIWARPDARTGGAGHPDRLGKSR
jgi:hypothetical protein